MAERPEDSRQPRPIVPDPDASLAGHHRSHPPSRARTWPLWLLILLLMAALLALAGAGWLERQRLEQRLARLDGEISNVHARFDASEGRGELLSQIQRRLGELSTLEDDLDARLEERLDGWQSQHLAPLADAQSDLDARLATLAEDGQVRADTLAAVRDSMDALEKASRESHAALGERLTGLESALDADVERIAALTQRVEQRHEALTQRLDEARNALDSLDDDVEALGASRDDVGERAASLEERLTDVQSELRELRQAQLATSARLEALRQ
ncbi:hypothetical protein [Halomonas organivorans]|uniref:Chromosome segregation ATPase n=1 Tax=Halomonas organivorans TaxID=257772 RepID=A0A7W5BXL5_9GAMM|nr:hypothetical protein [Halomonas organivorans]MBB3140940.1 chromosome segregation ATPase [Halomonas organivorans]